jgi:tripartite-type tricarboxylate transporter receptor subunit TctC
MKRPAALYAWLIPFVCLLSAPATWAQSFPEKPVRVVMPFPAGSTLDTVARLVGEKLKDATGQSFILDHKPGAGGIIAAQALMQSTPDGYTLLFASSGMLSINPHTYQSLPYDPFKDFAPVTMGVASQMVFAANGSVPAGTLSEFLAYAKGNPGKVAFASFTAGNPSHFAGIMLNQLAGIDMLHVPYKGSPPAVQDLLGGQVQSAFLPLIAVKPHFEQGKLKILAATGRERSPLMASVPTFVELGFPKLEVYIWAGFVAPVKTPAAIIQKLNADLVRALSNSEVRAKLQAIDLPPVPGTPEDFTRWLRGDFERWESAVKASGFKAD